MHERAERPSRTTRELRKSGADDGRERKAVIERSERYRRWIGEDGDGACRGID
jgi:hypothetical protein